MLLEFDCFRKNARLRWKNDIYRHWTCLAYLSAKWWLNRNKKYIFVISFSCSINPSINKRKKFHSIFAFPPPYNRCISANEICNMVMIHRTKSCHTAISTGACLFCIIFLTYSMWRNFLLNSCFELFQEDFWRNALFSYRTVRTINSRCK